MTDLFASELPYEEHLVIASDGVELAAQSLGSGPAVMLINGIGVTRPGLDKLAEHLSDRYRVICWDYRGTGESAVAKPELDDMSMPRHAADGIDVLDALAIDRAAVLGWSMGVPVGLEMVRAAPARVAGVGALFGAAGPPFRAAFQSPFSDFVELSFRSARHVPWPSQALVRLGAVSPSLAWGVCAGIRFVGGAADQRLFQACVRSVGKADKRAYFATMKHLMAHDARDVLPLVRCPMLIVAGDKDWVTPPSAAAEMKRQAPHAHYYLLRNTSHFGVIEHGPGLWRPVDRLLAEVYSDS